MPIATIEFKTGSLEGSVSFGALKPEIGLALSLSLPEELAGELAPARRMLESGGQGAVKLRAADWRETLRAIARHYKHLLFEGEPRHPFKDFDPGFEDQLAFAFEGSRYGSPDAISGIADRWVVLGRFDCSGRLLLRDPMEPAGFGDFGSLEAARGSWISALLLRDAGPGSAGVRPARMALFHASLHAAPSDEEMLRGGAAFFASVQSGVAGCFSEDAYPAGQKPFDFEDEGSFCRSLRMACMGPRDGGSNPSFGAMAENGGAQPIGAASQTWLPEQVAPVYAALDENGIAKAAYLCMDPGDQRFGFQA